MARWKTASPHKVEHGVSALGPHVLGAVLVLTAAIPGLIVVWLMPPPLVLPTLSLAALGAAGGFAFLAWWLHTKRHTERVNLWDVAGVCAFIGFAAGILSEPEYVLQLFEHAATVQ